tara:strand:+ start:6107 stop:7942 length:1836 start_codon:yes stop_codon:yes gene_type:complete
MLKPKISNINKKIILLLSDLIIIIISLTAAFSLRLEEFYPFWEIDLLIYVLYFLVLIFVFSFFNIYQILIRYFDNFSILKIVKAIFIFKIILISINLLIYEYVYFPRSVSFIAPILVGILIVIHRIILNYLINSDKNTNKYKNNIIIYGINENTVSLLNSLRQFPNYGLVKGFIDDLETYKKREINGIKIYKKNQLIKIIKEKKITEIIIGSNFYSDKKYRELFNLLQDSNIRIRRISNAKSYLKTFITKSLENKINFFDVIDRPKIKVDKNILKKNIYKKKILVTGGGGSIGGELCIEILKYSPSKLYILDISEINLFNLMNKLKNNNKLKNIVYPILGDCNDIEFLKMYFNKLAIDDIYHAAAYKHVSLGEQNPFSMIKNNIFSTKKIIDFVMIKKVKNFVFISSDKAVNPTSILGLTKRFGELITHNLYKQNKLKNTSFSVVRFGNVIGSSGSVIPIFLDQIEKKQSLTVTHKKVERYFMSINEAVQLVINSAYLNKKNFKIFALDMGKQIKIYEIANRIIKLSGNMIKNKSNPKGDIGIEFTGLKKGEKLSEEITLGKNLLKTSNNKIMICDEKVKYFDVNSRINEINKLIINSNFNKQKIKKLLNN